MARPSPKSRSLSPRERFEKEEDLARQRKANFPGYAGELKLGEETPRSKTVRTISARQYGPALRTAKKTKKK